MDRARNVLKYRRKIEKAVISILCVIVGIIVAFVLLNTYRPDKNTLRAFASVCMDTICLIIMLIMVIGLVIEGRENNKTGELYRVLLLGTIIAMFFDFLTWSSDGLLAYDNWTYVFTVSSLCCGPILGLIFVLYLSSYLYELYQLKSVKKVAKWGVALNAIAFFITALMAITKSAFLFRDGHYEAGILYDVVTVVPVLTLLIMTIYAIRYVKTIGIHDLIAIIGYIVLMIVGALVESRFSIGTTYVAVSLADIFIYVMLQNQFIDRVNRQIVEEKRNVQKWMERSNTDELTGFYNRHAYEEEMSRLKRTILKENFVYVSIDVNGLKIVNDTLGHDAGDELILGACECMEKCFGKYGDLYRTGGDEFAALIYVDDDKLKEIKKNIQEVTSKWHGKKNASLAMSCGYVTQKQADRLSIHEIAVLADKKMYEAKTKYYQQKGVDRRGQRDAHVALCDTYTKILKINITDDTYQIVSMNEEEQSETKGFSDKISKWLHDFGTSGQVHPDDLGKYLQRTDVRFISSYFKSNRKTLLLSYRRKYGDEYKQSVMEIIPANDYTHYSQKLFLYVKNIE